MHLFRCVLVRNWVISPSNSRELVPYLFAFTHTLTARLPRRCLETEDHYNWDVLYDADNTINLFFNLLIDNRNY